MEYLLENLNLNNNNNNNNNCFSSKSIWFVVAMGVLAVQSVILAFLFVSHLGFSFRSPSSASIKRKKRADRKKKRAGNITTADVSAAAISQPLLKEAKVSRIREFFYQSLLDMTQNFKSECRVSADSLGEFFIEKIVDTDEVFTIKNMWVYIPDYTHQEFVAHVSLLSQANHSNLAKLIGYSFRKPWERALVYEYVPGGSLEDYLYDSDKCLDWKVRMKIALGVAEAVKYLQNNMDPSILHLYIEPCNVWLNEEFIPKLSSYGEVMMYSREKSVDFPWEMIGTYCYANLDFELTKNVTIQTDIYCFGVLLLKMITGQNDYVSGDGLSQKLLDWVQPYLKDKQHMAEMVDSKLEGKFKNDDLYEACDIVEACLNEQPASRPSIVDLVKRMNHLGL